jgi:hypothetical protein
MRILRLGLGFALMALLAPGLVAQNKKPCFEPLSKCPKRGCADPGTPDAMTNILKRNLNPSGDVKELTFQDFETLQTRAEEKLGGETHQLTKSDRLKLRKLNVGSKTAGEGDLVELIGFVAVKPGNSKPHANTSGESVNCRIPKSENNDFHISLSPKSEGSEFEGIVVEMVPQKRDDNWTTSRLIKAQKEKRMVRVRGQLFFDNHHFVNKDPDNNISNQPKRMSLWEIHPVTEFDVCTKAKCEADDSAWKPLAEWQPGS